MDPQQTEQIRYSVLRYAAAAERFASSRLLLQFLRSEGNSELTLGQLGKEIQYLIDKKLIAPVDKVISPENVCVRITADGRDWMATHQSDNP
jgi:hypothetical protein